MSEHFPWNLMEGIFSKIPISYPVLSLLVSALIFLIYLAFMFVIKLEDFQYDPNSLLQIIFTSTFIAYLLIGNQYILDNLMSYIDKLKYVSGKEQYQEEIYDILDGDISKLNGFYLLLFVVIAPFILKDFLEIYLGATTFDQSFFSSNIFNIYNYSVFLFSLYLLTNMIWIVIKISQFFKDLARGPYQEIVQIDLFCTDKMGGLGHLRRFVVNAILYYSLGISIAVMAYVNPGGYQDVYFEIGYLLLLLAAGIVLLIKSSKELQDLFRREADKEIFEINEKIKQLYRRLMEIAAIKKDGDKWEEELNFISSSIELLNKQRAERESLLRDNAKTYNLKDKLVAFNSFIMVLFALYEKLNNFGIISFLLESLNLKN